MGSAKPNQTSAHVSVRSDAHVDEAFVGGHRFCKESVVTLAAAEARELAESYPYLLIADLGATDGR